MSCSLDGSVCLPYKNNLLMKVSDRQLYSITELRDNKIACCCYDGLKIIPSLLLQDPKLFERMNSISSSLDSIRNSSSDQKTQLISLLQHHLAQLLTPVKHQPERLTGLALSLLPDLKSIQRSYSYEGSAVGRRKILTRNYCLELMSLKSTVPRSQAILNLFDRKLKLLGKVTDADDPTVDFKTQLMRRGKWVFSMLDQTGTRGPARVNFLNGYLDCFTYDGYLTDRSGFHPSLKVDEMLKTVVSVANHGIVLTTDRTTYFLNLKTNTIEDL